MNVLPLDLNLLVVFDAVWRYRNVSRAAEAVGLSQPAVSNALRRLREHFHDPLFVRSASGMLPTTTAQELGATVSEALARISGGLARRHAFVAASAARTFTIIMTDVGEIVFLPRLLEHCKREAPGVSIRTVQMRADETRSALESGAVDLAVGFVPDLRTGVYQQRLFETEYVCIVRRSHPRIGERITRTEFQAARHAIAEAEGTGHYVVERTLSRLKPRPQIGLRAPHFLALPMIVGGTDLVATVPRPLADALGRSAGVRLLEHPLKLPRIEIKQFWHQRFHEDPGNRWLRGTIAGLYAAGR
jgi:DNA-binding transcriptional LysR family regulator